MSTLLLKKINPSIQQTFFKMEALRWNEESFPFNNGINPTGEKTIA
jgi:hypothetical protein